MTLYEISNEIERLYDEVIDPETGEISDDGFSALSDLQMEMDAKVESIALWHKNTVAESEAIDKEIKNLKSRKEALDKKAEWQKGLLSWALKGQKFETPKVAISFRTSQSVDFYDEQKFCERYLGTDYVTTKTESKPNKNVIKSLLKVGGELDGAELVTKRNIQIK